MPVTIAQYIKQLKASGILAEETLNALLPPRAEPRTTEELIRELVRQKKLTKFQAEEVYRGRGHLLTLGNYLLLDLIGAGGMGRVYKAKHRRMDRLVAVKILPPAMTKEKSAIARFEREAKAAAKLRHPNIVAADDADCASGIHFLVMEYMEGQDLYAYVKKHGPLSVEDATNYTIQVAHGLEYAHKKGVIHRDIKPANLLLSHDNTVKILDMGLARLNTTEDDMPLTDLTSTGVILGTIDYMAPEQALDTKQADARADIYSLGCAMYFILTGKILYEADTIMKKLLAHREAEIPSICDIRSDVPHTLDHIFKQMVSKSLQDRYQSMSEVIMDLERFRSGSASTFHYQKSNVLPPPASLSDDQIDLNFLHELPQRPVLEQLKRKPSTTVTSRYLWTVFAIISVLIMLEFYILSQSKRRQLHVDIDQPDTLVQVLNNSGKSEFTERCEKGKTMIHLNPGIHVLKIEKPGFDNYEHVFDLNQKKSETIAVKLIPAQQSEMKSAIAPNTDSGKQSSTTTVENEWRELFDGKTLRGWSGNLELITIENGTLINDNKSGVIIAPGEYHNMQCELEFRLENGGNSGIGICYTGTGDPSQNGLEIQLLDDAAYPNNNDFQKCGSIYQLASTKPGHFKRWPEWNRLSIQSTDQLVQVKMNDVIVSEVLRQILQQNFPQHPEVFRTTGKICLFPIARRSEYRNLRIKELAMNVVDAVPSIIDWIKSTELLPANQQLEAVSKKLMELNPRFNGKLTGAVITQSPVIEDGNVIEIGFDSDHVKDISPVRAFTKLKVLNCSSTFRSGDIADLSPLKGMSLSRLICNHTQVSDLSALAGMPLTHLQCALTPVKILTPLRTCYNLMLVDVAVTKVDKDSVSALQKALPRCRVVWDDPDDPATKPQTVIVDLLPLIDPELNVLRGDWNFKGGGITSASVSNNSVLQIPYELPESYQLDLVVERVSNIGFGMSIFFASAGKQGTIVLEGTSSKLCALEMLDGKSSHQFKSPYRPLIFALNKPTSLRVNIVRNGITVIADEKTIIDWAGDFASFSISPNWPIPKENNIFLGTQTGMKIHSIKLSYIKPPVK
jgi:serine/threonine protein kinase